MKRKHNGKRALTVLYFSTLFFFLFMTDVRAYIDPSVMTYAIQAAAGIIIALSTVIGVYWRKIRNVLFGSAASKAEMESDRLEFHDPSTGITRTIPQAFAIPPAVKKKKSWISPSFLPAVCLSAAMSFMLCFYSPLEIFFTNVSEFEYDVYAIAGYIFLLFGIVLAVMILGFYVIYRISKKLYFVFLVLGTICFLAFYVQGNFLIGDLPPSDGREIDWSIYGKQELQSALLWAVCTIICIGGAVLLKRKKFGNAVSILTTGITVILAITLVTLGIQNKGFTPKRQLCYSSDALNVVSSDQNFIILILDALDSATFAHLMETDDPDFAEVFEDFTYYPDTLGCYTFTGLAVPQLLTGKIYRCEETFEDYYRNAQISSPFLNRLKQENYLSGIYEVSYIDYNPELYNYENVYERPYGIGSIKNFLLDELRMSFFLYMPWQLKKYEPYALFNLLNEEPAEYFFNWRDRWFYDYLGEHPIEVKDGKRFRFIHTEGAHAPHHYDKQLNEVDGTYESNVEGAITMTERYLTMLRESGAYDNSIILVMADHGVTNDPISINRANPLLMVKGLNERHKLETSDAVMSYAWLQDLYLNLLDGKTGEDALPEETETETTRLYYDYDYASTDYIAEMKLEGKTAYGGNALEPTGNLYYREGLATAE